jgi:5-methylcytosine-specific restriction endonuclease McrA
MAKLEAIVAAHPINKKPYHCIRFVKLSAHGKPLYTVTGDVRALGALKALKVAFELHGGHCFHCGRWLEPQKLSQSATRDHVHPKAEGGHDYLHNLVITCGNCNRSKAATNIVDFQVERGKDYLQALDAHIARCIAAMTD